MAAGLGWRLRWDSGWVGMVQMTRQCPDYQEMPRLSGNAQITRQCPDYQAMPRVPSNAQITKQCPDYQAMPRQSGNAKSIRQCPDYQAMPRLSNNAQIIRQCPDYQAMPRLSNNAQITKQCPDSQAIPINIPGIYLIKTWYPIGPIGPIESRGTRYEGDFLLALFAPLAFVDHFWVGGLASQGRYTWTRPCWLESPRNVPTNQSVLNDTSNGNEVANRAKRVNRDPQGQ